MTKKVKHLVFLKPDAILHFKLMIEVGVISKSGLISCSSLSQEHYFLELDAVPEVSTDKAFSVHLMIPYSLILYVVSSSDHNLDKILGFHADTKKSAPRLGP